MKILGVGYSLRKKVHKDRGGGVWFVQSWGGGGVVCSFLGGGGVFLLRESEGGWGPLYLWATVQDLPPTHTFWGDL